MRGLRRASLWTLTRKSKGSRETEITAFAVMPSAYSSHPLVTTVTPVGKWLIAPLRASASAESISQGYSLFFAPREPSGGIGVLSDRLDSPEATTHGCPPQAYLPHAAPPATTTR